jgi:Flp pilus assembly protein TadG
MSIRARMPARHFSRCHNRGLATVEFVLCAPVLFLLMFATAEVGRALYQYNTLMKSVRDGARYAVVNASVGTTRIVNITTQTANATRNLVVTGNTVGTGTPLLPGLTVGNVTVSDAGNGFVQVAANYTYQPMLGATLPTLGLTAPISLTMSFPATVVMRAL